jgi:hypothetical protein
MMCELMLGRVNDCVGKRTAEEIVRAEFDDLWEVAMDHARAQGFPVRAMGEVISARLQLYREAGLLKEEREAHP